MRPHLVLIAACLVVAGAFSSTGAAADGPSVGPSVALVDQLWSSEGSADIVITKELHTTLVQARSGSTRRLLWQARVHGLWGAPQVTQYGDLGGLARGAHTVVLQQLASSPGRSRFAVIHASAGRASTRMIDLAGSFAFDALSPHANLLYLVEAVNGPSFGSYRVRSYDLRTGRLRPRVITERGEPATAPMHGVPTARATSRRGDWVFTLYLGSNGGSFIHALHASTATARCIDLPWHGTYAAYRITAFVGRAGLTLNDDRGVLLAAVNLKTWRVFPKVDPTRGP